MKTVVNVGFFFLRIFQIIMEIVIHNNNTFGRYCVLCRLNFENQTSESGAEREQK